MQTSQIAELTKKEMPDLFFLKAKTHHAWLDRPVSDWLCNIGYGDPFKLHPRGPRFDFHKIAKVV